MTGLERRVALITGAGENLGRAVALAFARAGANVAVNVRENKVHGDDVADAVRRHGVEALTVVADVSDADADDAMVAEVERALGPVDMLVHCVGLRSRTPIVELSNDEWQRVMDVNCSSFLYLAQRVLPSMAERGFGRLVAIGGIAAERAAPNYAALAASKAALTSLTRAVAVEFGARGVTANVVSPAMTETMAAEFRTPERLQELVAIPRVARLDEIASACVYLASDEGAYVTGQTLRVDGGFSI